MGQTAGKDPVGEAIARAAPKTLAAKAAQAWPRMAVLAVLAGTFIAFGSTLSLVAQAGTGDGPTLGPTLVLSGLAFSVGLILVMIAGAELFTGNTMMCAAGRHRRTLARTHGGRLVHRVARQSHG